MVGLVECEQMYGLLAISHDGKAMTALLSGLRNVPMNEKGSESPLTNLTSQITWLLANVFASGGRGTMGRCYRSDCRWSESRFGGPWSQIPVSLRA